MKGQKTQEARILFCTLTVTCQIGYFEIKFHFFLKKQMGQPRPLSVYFRSFSNTIYTEKTVGFSETRTRIVGIEGKHADHLTTTAPISILYV